MSTATLTREESVNISAELMHAFLTLESLTNSLRRSNAVAKLSVGEYEILMNSLIEEYDAKL